MPFFEQPDTAVRDSAIIQPMAPAAPDVQVTRVEGAGLVPFLEKYALPERFTATITPPEPDLPICHLSIAVENGRAVCEHLGLQRKPDGPPIDGTALRRISLPDCVHRAVDQVGHWRIPGEGSVKITADGETYPQSSEPAGEGHVATRLGGITRTKQYKAATRAHRGQVSDETLLEVADVYRSALARGHPPTQAVMTEWVVSRSTASRWLKRARQAGHLGPAMPRLAGWRSSDA